MDFQIVANHMLSPRLIYEGNPIDAVSLKTVDSTVLEHCFEIDWRKPENKKWRHYYNDKELNALSELLDWGLFFAANHEYSVNKATGLCIDIQPFFYDDSEYSICYSYQELAQCFGRYWLNAVLKRKMTRQGFNKRVTEIKKYWM